jgi:3-phytase
VFAIAAAMAGALGTAPGHAAEPSQGVAPSPDAERSGPIRIATFNASLNRGAAGEMLAAMSGPDDPQVRAVASIIQATRPDILLLNEFDYEPDDALVTAFQEGYLSVAQGDGLEPIEYPHVFTAPTNTGTASGFDLNNDGQAVTEPGADGYGDDALGFGLFPGQYGMAVLSAHPIDEAGVRSFANLLWRDMPGALLPDDPATDTEGDWYTQDELAVVRLSSKSHWDVPITIGDRTIRFL